MHNVAPDNDKLKAILSLPALMTAKAEEIRRVLSEPVVDLWKLRELALTEGGLVNGKLPIVCCNLNGKSPY